jgi:hypothetical protein
MITEPHTKSSLPVGGNRPQLPQEDPLPLSRSKPWLSTPLLVKAGPAMLETLQQQ